ncbi:MAG: alpha/beta hydrolase [Candidatus Methylomirabilis sp.]|nr:alpha/beta hydrolase [Deltaproteobacteria bacterium]
MSSRAPAYFVLVVLAGLTATACRASTPAFRDASGRLVPTSVADMRRIPVNGTTQYLLIRGRDRSAPLLLILHGGPGASETPFFRLYNAALEERLVVVYWDQRGAGKSFDADIAEETMTVAQFLADLDAVVDHLRASFGRDRVALLGHSWGTALGALYAHAHPEKVSAYIGVAQESNTPAAEAEGYRWALAEARRRSDEDAVRALEEIGPPPHTVEEMLVARRRVMEYGGSFHEPRSLWKLTFAALSTEEATLADFPRFLRGNLFSLRAMWPELRELDLTERARRFAVPVFFFLGRYDKQVPSTEAAKYFERIEAPTKRLLWFERSAHNVPFEEPAAFNRAVLAALAEAGVLGESREAAP